MTTQGAAATLNPEILNSKREPASKALELVPISANFGDIYCGDSLQLVRSRRILKPGSVNLIMTSPPFGLARKKEYGNVDAEEYVRWFRPFAQHLYNLLSDNGSPVIDVGSAWVSGQPTKSLYHYELLIMLCKKIGFHLAQEFFWWNPSQLPTPAEWVTVRRVSVKDAGNCIWWLSNTPWPKASNLRVLQPYSSSMRDLLEKGYKAKLRPNRHDISENFSIDNDASIPPNLIAVANTESNSAYLRYCQEHGIPAHPARYPEGIPEYFIRMLTDENNLVLDPFAGSCVTGKVTARLGRRWIYCDLREDYREDYVEGPLGRFNGQVGQVAMVRQTTLIDGPSAAETNGVTCVSCKKGNHAEENLLQQVPNRKRVGTSVRAPCDSSEHNCAGQLSNARVQVEQEKEVEQKWHRRLSGICL